LGLDAADDFFGAAHRHGVGVDALVADDLHGVVAVVDAGLEELDSLTGVMSALDAAKELFRLAAEHRAANDLDASDALFVEGEMLSALDHARGLAQSDGPWKRRGQHREDKKNSGAASRRS